MTNKKALGYFYAIISAVFYGLNPLGAIYLNRDGMDIASILFYRNSMAIAMLGLLMMLQRRSFRIDLKQAGVLLALGLLFIISSITLYYSYNFLDAGIASTLLFIYPIMVAAIMVIFFKEGLTMSTTLSILLSLVGVALLYRGGEGAVISTFGVLLVLLSALSYALYIVVVNRFPNRPASVTLTFYVLIVCALTSALFSYISPESAEKSLAGGEFLFGRIALVKSLQEWGWLLMLSLCSSVIALVCMAKASKSIGPTPTAILGALEPVTGVVVGLVVFNESLSLQLASGIVLILSSVILLILRKNG